MQTLLRNKSVVVLTLSVFFLIPAFGQQSNNQDTVEGTVVSSSRNTLVVRTDDDRHQLYIFDRNTTRPRSLAVGTRVSVTSTLTDEAGVRLARTVTPLGEGSASPSTSASSSSSSSSQAGPVGKQTAPPSEVRDLERDIRRQVRRWRLGVRAGAALDPELFMFGVHSQMGPIFRSDISFRRMLSLPSER